MRASVRQLLRAAYENWAVGAFNVCNLENDCPPMIPQKR